jgi:hypothetical protein
MRITQCSAGHAVLVTASLLFPFTSLKAQLPSQSACKPFPANPLYLQDENPTIQEGDFNGDGITDLVAFTTKGVTVLLGKGDGAFHVSGTFPPAETSAGAGFTVGDFNNDGKLDVAVTLANGTVDILPGNGDGTFQKPVPSSIATYTSFLQTVDLNHDGHLDLVGIPSNGSEVQVLLGNGNGTFQAPVAYSVGAYASKLIIADLNGDGKADLAVANAGFLSDPGHTVSILLGNGDGTFQPQTTFQVGNQPFGITAADFNGDGHLDIATANYLDGTASVIFGNGDGSFQAPTTYATGHPYAPYDIAAIVFGPGQKPGLAVATLAGVYILTNKGNGTFHAGQGYDPGSGQVLIGDFNGDGKADLALGAGEFDTDSGVGILLGLGNGAFATSTAYAAVPNTEGLAAGDFNGDGIMDLAVGELDGPYFAIMMGLGKGKFAEPQVTYKLPHSASSVAAIAAGDLNGDGKPDLVVASDGPWEVVTLFGTGSGTFTNGPAYPLIGEWPGAISLVDLNNDGKLDMAAVSAGNYDSQGALSILLGNGDGTFQSAVGYGVDEGSAGVLGPAIADFNGDGILDIALADGDSSELIMLLGNGDGTFRAGPVTPLTASIYGIAAADFNGDGKADIALLTGIPDIRILTGNGDGSFQSGASFAAQYGSWLTAADLNGDGHVDLAVLTGEGYVQFFSGNGDGTFGPATPTYTGIDPGLRNLVVADLNGDGSPDLAAPNYDSGSVSVLLNRCPAN